MKHVERVLLLGGGGFLGRALGLRLLDRGIEVHSITRGTQLDMPDGIVMHAGGMENLTRQNQQFARARDLLLPKLMSGQLDVSGIRLPEEVAA